MSHSEAVSRFSGFLQGETRLEELGFDLPLTPIETQDWMEVEDQVIAIGAGVGMEP